jgi:hypothetical protein
MSEPKPTVFIHTNPKQMLGALVSRYSFRRNSKTPDAFDVQIVSTEDFPWMKATEGRRYLRDGLQREWLYDDLQSFTPLRFTPPELMGYQGRALMVDPDVFAVGDVMPLFSRDMGGKALMARKRGGDKEFASSVMLLDCAKLTHWQVEKQFNEMFSGERDYMEWISLKLEPKGSIGELEAEWNDFDHLTPETKLLHNTKRWTQPWKTGLPVDFTPSSKTRRFAPLGWFRRAREAVLGRYGGLGTYKRHPDPKQEAFFFALLAECVEKGEVSREMVEAEMAKNHVRHDAFEVMARAADTTSRAAA